MIDVATAFKTCKQIQDELREIISRVTYKPNWKFDVWGTNVTVIACMPDVSNLELTVDIAITRPLMDSYCVDEDLVLGNLRKAILELEEHEMDEWLKINHAHVKEPHPKEQGDD